MIAWLTKAPALLRTVSAGLVVAAGVADQVLANVDLTQGFNKAALYTALIGLIRAGARKVAK